MRSQLAQDTSIPKCGWKLGVIRRRGTWTATIPRSTRSQWYTTTKKAMPRDRRNQTIPQKIRPAPKYKQQRTRGYAPTQECHEGGVDFPEAQPRMLPHTNHLHYFPHLYHSKTFMKRLHLKDAIPQNSWEAYIVADAQLENALTMYLCWMTAAYQASVCERLFKV